MGKPSLEQFQLNNNLVKRCEFIENKLEKQNNILMWVLFIGSFSLVLYFNKNDILLGLIIGLFLSLPISGLLSVLLFKLYKLTFYRNHCIIKKQLDSFSKKISKYENEQYVKASNVVADYGLAIEKSAGMIFGAPISMLSNTKDEIKDAIKIVLNVDYKKREKKYIESLIYCYFNLAKFIPDDDAKLVNKGLPPHWMNSEKISTEELINFVDSEQRQIKEGKLENRINEMRNKINQETIYLGSEIGIYVDQLNKKIN